MPLVEPPLAAIPVIAFSSPRRLRKSRAGRPSSLARRAARAPASAACASRCSSSSAATIVVPDGVSPRNSSASPIVLAVKFPAQVPGPGHAVRSTSSSSARESRPWRKPPTASHTSWIVACSPCQRTGAHRAAVDDDARLVDPRQRHQRRGHGLVAADDADQRVEVVRDVHQLDRVGDQLARHERRAHPGRALRLVVGDRDRVERERDPAGGLDAPRHRRGELEVVEVAGHRAGPARCDADDRSVEAARVDPHRAEVRTRSRAARIVRQGLARQPARRLYFVVGSGGHRASKAACAGLDARVSRRRRPDASRPSPGGSVTGSQGCASPGSPAGLPASHPLLDQSSARSIRRA